MPKLSRLFILAGIAAMFVSCGTKKQTGNAELKEKKLVVAQGADARSLDPHKAIDTPSVRVYSQIYDQLVRHDTNMKIVPNLAEKWEQLDEKTTVFHLKKGVKFHNGEPLTATDVKFSIERMKEMPTVSFLVSEIDSVEVIDASTVKIITKRPFGPLLSHLAHPGAGILNKNQTEKMGNEYGQNPVGTGPFKFSEWAPGDNIKLAVNPDYYRGASPINQVVFRNISEGNSRSIGLETGEIDIATDIDAMDRSRVANHEKLNLYEGESLGTAYMGLNMEKEPFNKKEVRQAIHYAIDVDPILEAVYQNTAVAADSPLSPKIQGYAGGKTYKRDIEKSKQLLAAAGYPDGFKMSVWVNDSSVRKDIATIFQAQVKDVGIDMNIEVLEWGAYIDRTAKGEHDAYILGWITVTGDADYGLYPLFHSSAFGRPGNRSFYHNPEVDNMLDIARSSLNAEERKELYGKVQKQVQEDLPMITFAFTGQNAGANKKVQNFVLHPTGYHEIYGIDIKEDAQ